MQQLVICKSCNQSYWETGAFSNGKCQSCLQRRKRPLKLLSPLLNVNKKVAALGSLGSHSVSTNNIITKSFENLNTDRIPPLLIEQSERYDFRFNTIDILSQSDYEESLVSAINSRNCNTVSGIPENNSQRPKNNSELNDSDIENMNVIKSNNISNADCEEQSCLVCNISLARFSVENRETHLESCFQRIEAVVCDANDNILGDDLIVLTQLPNSGIRSDDYNCTLCGYNLNNKRLAMKCGHLKRCAKLNGISTKELLSILAPTQSNEWWSDGAQDQENDNDTLLPEKSGKSVNNSDNIINLIDESSLDNNNTANGLNVDHSIVTESEGFTRNDDLDQLNNKHVNSESPKDPLVKNAFAILMKSASTNNNCRNTNNSTGGRATTTSDNNLYDTEIPINLFTENFNKNRNTMSTKNSNRSKGNTNKNNKGYSRWKNYNAQETTTTTTTGEAVSSEDSPGFRITPPPPYKLIRGPGMSQPVIIDGFQWAHRSVSQCYFLTHFHSDHYCGLSKHFDAGRVFCSPTTAALVKLRLGLTSQVIPLELEKKHTIAVCGGSIDVVLLEANHCPGAVCLLFTFTDGRQVLHTGDFRWCPSLLRTSEAWKRLAASVASPMTGGGVSAANPHSLSPLVVYLDTTYCEPSHTFPPQHSTISAVISCVQSELAKGGSPLFVFGAYGIGKERVYMAVAEALNMSVYVDNTRWKNMLCFDWPTTSLARLTTDCNVTNLWVAPLGQINFKSLTTLKMKRKGGGISRIIGFQPTGWTFQGGDKKPTDGMVDALVSNVENNPEESANVCVLRPRNNGQDVIFAVPYSEHSSFPELIDFLRTFRPQHVVPTVGTSKEKSNQQIEVLKQWSGLCTLPVTTTTTRNRPPKLSFGIKEFQ